MRFPAVCPPLPRPVYWPQPRDAARPARLPDPEPADDWSSVSTGPASPACGTGQGTASGSPGKARCCPSSWTGALMRALQPGQRRRMVDMVGSRWTEGRPAVGGGFRARWAVGSAGGTPHKDVMGKTPVRTFANGAGRRKAALVPAAGVPRGVAEVPPRFAGISRRSRIPRRRLRIRRSRCAGAATKGRFQLGIGPPHFQGHQPSAGNARRLNKGLGPCRWASPLERLARRV